MPIVSTVSIVPADVSIRLKNKKVLYFWIKKVIQSENKTAGEVLITLCSDDYLLEMNKKFLFHNYYTDILTFDYSKNGIISGELYISIDRIKENAEKFKSPFRKELQRVIAHGVLHLCGYCDKSKAEVRQMRKKENQKLKLLLE